MPLFKKKNKKQPNRTRGFKPSKHGFAFANTFRMAVLASSLPRALRVLVAAPGVPQDYGLCGGMSFSASDFFDAGCRIPSNRTAPRPDSDLYKFIFQRQLDSFGVSFRHIVRVRDWMHKNDVTVEVRTAKEVRKVVETLQEGKFAPLYLIRVRAGAGKPWDNHQVMAYDYRDRTRTAKCIDLKIYDPNEPGDDTQVIEVRFVKANQVTCCQLSDSGNEAVRGFFTRPFSAKIKAARKLA